MKSCILILLAAVLAAADLQVVATVPVVADLTRQVAGDRAVVAGLVPPGVDLHSWTPTPADAQALAAARVVVANGLGLEPWLAGALAASGSRAVVVEAAAGVEARAGDDHDHDHGGTDPHAFHDVRNAQQYVKNIRDALVAADSANAAWYRARADLVLARLGVLDAWVRRQLAGIPPERRVLITPHGGFAYYAAAYRLEAVGIAGAGGAEADAQAVAAVVAQVRQRGIPVLFRERGQPDGLLAAIAREGAARLAGPLAGDGPGPGCGYDEMIAANTLAIAEALGR